MNMKQLNVGGADVRPLPGGEEILPEGLKRPRVGPDHKPVERK